MAGNRISNNGSLNDLNEVWDIKNLTSKNYQNNSNEAMQILKKISQDALYVMKKNKYQVKLLKEFYPKTKNLYGMNQNKGQIIFIRLRHPNNCNEFLPYETLLDTMLHELVHNEIGPHSDKFYEKLEELRLETENAMINAGNSSSSYNDDNTLLYFQGNGETLGGNRSYNNNYQQHILKAAEKRFKNQTILGINSGNAHRLGSSGSNNNNSNSNISPQELKEKALQAAERRQRDAEQCGSCNLNSSKEEQEAQMTKMVQSLSSSSSSSSSNKNNKTWTCKLCTYINIGSKSNFCDVCETVYNGDNIKDSNVNSYNHQGNNSEQDNNNDNKNDKDMKRENPFKEKVIIALDGIGDENKMKKKKTSNQDQNVLKSTSASTNPNNMIKHKSCNTISSISSNKLASKDQSYVICPYCTYKNEICKYNCEICKGRMNRDKETINTTVTTGNKTKDAKEKGKEKGKEIIVFDLT